MDNLNGKSSGRMVQFVKRDGVQIWIDRSRIFGFEADDANPTSYGTVLTDKYVLPIKGNVADFAQEQGLWLETNLPLPLESTHIHSATGYAKAGTH